MSMFAPIPPDDATALRRRFVASLAVGIRGLGEAGATAVRLAWLLLRRALGIVFALILLFEQWGWQWLLQLFQPLARLKPIAALEAMIARLPPYAALAVFATPAVMLLPLKLLALYLIAHGHAISAALLFIGAKVVGTALVARLYQLTEKQLMQIGWVRRAHDAVMPRLHALHEHIRRSWAWRYGRMLKTRTKLVGARILARVRARLAG